MVRGYYLFWTFTFAKYRLSDVKYGYLTCFDDETSLFSWFSRGTICTCLILFVAHFDKGCVLFCENNLYHISSIDFYVFLRLWYFIFFFHYTRVKSCYSLLLMAFFSNQHFITFEVPFWWMNVFLFRKLYLADRSLMFHS